MSFKDSRSQSICENINMPDNKIPPLDLELKNYSLKNLKKSKKSSLPDLGIVKNEDRNEIKIQDRNQVTSEVKNQ